MAQNRAYGSGTIFRRTDGLWVARITRDGRRMQRASKTRDVVHAWLDEMAPHRDHESSRPRQQAMKIARSRGTHTAQEWDDLCAQAQGLCTYCRRPWERLVKDHRTPVARGGSDGIENIAPSCTACNLAKGNKTEAEFRAYLSRRGLPSQAPVWESVYARAQQIRDAAARMAQERGWS